MKFFNSLQIDHAIKALIFQIESMQTKAFEREIIKKLGITQARFVLLQKLLMAGGSMKQTDFTHTSEFEPNTVSTISNRMQKDGLLRKYNDLEYKHMVRIEITDKGKDVHGKAMKILNRVNKSIMSDFSKDEKIQLLSLLYNLQNKMIPIVLGEGRSLLSIRIVKDGKHTIKIPGINKI